MKYFPFISPAKTPTIIPETRQGVRHGESEGRPRRVLRGLDDIDERVPCRVVGVKVRGSLGVPSHGVQVAGQARVFDEKESITMARSNKTLVPEAKQALNQFKMEAANEVGVTLNQGYNGQLTSAQAGSIGGQMVNNMNPVRTMRFERHNRISQGHKITVKYAFSLTV